MPWAPFYKQLSCSILAFQNYFLYKISPDDSDAAETPDSSKPETVPETGEPVKLKLTIKKDDVGSQWMIRDVPVLKKRGRKRKVSGPGNQKPEKTNSVPARGVKGKRTGLRRGVQVGEAAEQPVDEDLRQDGQHHWKKRKAEDWSHEKFVDSGHFAGNEVGDLAEAPAGLQTRVCDFENYNFGVGEVVEEVREKGGIARDKQRSSDDVEQNFDEVASNSSHDDEQDWNPARIRPGSVERISEADAGSASGSDPAENPELCKDVEDDDDRDGGEAEVSRELERREDASVDEMIPEVAQTSDSTSPLPETIACQDSGKSDVPDLNHEDPVAAEVEHISGKESQNPGRKLKTGTKRSMPKPGTQDDPDDAGQPEEVEEPESENYEEMFNDIVDHVMER